jgi:hypothetical protein
MNMKRKVTWNPVATAVPIPNPSFPGERCLKIRNHPILRGFLKPWKLFVTVPGRN